MSHIFISYRRDDTSIVSGRIYDRLIDAFGRPAVFKDVDNIPLGVNFADHIAKVVDTCAVQLVVIGPHWLDATDVQGRRRLDDPADFVRLEIEAALRRGIPIIPLMVDGAPVPASAHLPSTMHGLPFQNGSAIRATDFDRDIGKVTTRLTQWVKPLPGVKVAPGRSMTSAGLLYGLILAVINTIIGALGALLIGSLSRSSSSTGQLIIFFIALYLAPAFIICYLAGQTAGRGAGRVIIGAGAGLIAAILGSSVGGALFGALMQTPAVTPGASGSSADVQNGALSGLFVGLILSLFVGSLVGVLGGLAGKTKFQKATITPARSR